MASVTSNFQLTRIKNGTDGKTYQPIRIRQWEDIPVNTSTGGWDTVPDDCKIWDGLGESPYTDIVFVVQSGSRVFYRCIQSCTRDGSRLPSDTYYRNHLRQASSYDMVATKVILAEQGAIGLLASNAINLFDSAGTQKGQMKGVAAESDFLLWLGGSLDNPMFGVTGIGHAYFGGMTGQRVEIDPVEKAMRIFDSNNNLVATHSGRAISLEEAVPGAGTAGTTSKAVTISQVVCPSSTSGYYTNTGYSADITGTYNGTGSATIKVNIPSVQISGRLTTATNGARCGITLRAVIYVGRSPRATVELGSLNATNATNQTVTTAARTFSCPVFKGESYRVVLELTGRTTSPTAQNGYFAVTTTSNYSMELVAQGYRCEYGGNGWVISYNSNNYEYCLVINGVLYRKIVSGGKTILTT